MIIDYIIKKNQETAYDKPNEDFLIARKEDNFFIVADGVTRELDNGIYPSPSPASTTSEILCNYMLENWRKEDLNYEHFRKKIRKDFLDANTQLRTFNSSIDKGLSGFEAGTVAILCTVVGNKIFLAYVGDCSCSIIRNGKFIQLTEPQTKLVVKNRTKFSRYEIRRNICNNSSHPFGFGVFNGDPNVADFLVFLEYEVENQDIILLYSDGFDPIMLQEFADFIRSASLEKVVSETEKLDIIKKNRSDDKSLIRIKFYE